MDNQAQAETLNQLSRLLFDRAAGRWQWSLCMGVTSGLLGLIASLLGLSMAASAVCAGVAGAILLVGYILRFSFEKTHDVAETMRRQSVMSEGLDWPITKTQFNEWRQLAGKRLLSSAASNPRPADYYETASVTGAKRLAEMTFESLFWTKSLYRKMQFYLTATLVVTVVSLVVLLAVAPLFKMADSARVTVAYFVFLIIPILVSLDLFGFIIKQRRAVLALCLIEPHLEQLAAQDDPALGEVMRLVAEYNCTVAVGLPIPQWVFTRHYDEIQGCWG